MREHMTPTAVVSNLYALFGAGRIDETFDVMDPGVVLHEPGDPSLLPWAGTHVGHAGLTRFYEALGQGLSEIEIDRDTLELLPVGDNRVLALGTERGVSADTGRAYETQSAWLWTLRDGLITELRAFHDTAAMSAAFNQAESL